MIEFEKIKTASDKKHALEKRNGTIVTTDFQPGDILTFCEKLDGHNISFNNEGVVMSRKNIITDDWMTHYKPIIKLQDFVTNAAFKELIASAERTCPYLTAGHEYQFFGEFMVRSRIIPYKESVYDSLYLFDIYDHTAQRYLGILTARQFVLWLKEYAPSSLSDRLLIPNIPTTNYIFTSYEDMERFAFEHKNESIYSQSGVAEGMVVTNTTRSFGLNPLRVKVVNKEYKEVQREQQKPARTKALRWLMTYLTNQRVMKHLLNMQDVGMLNPKKDDYYTLQLEKAVSLIREDILSESIDTPIFSDNDRKDVYNKIEGFTRLIMIENKTFA